MGIIMAQIHKTRGIVGSILHTPITYHLNMSVKMKANQINAAALANTAREVIAMCDNKKYTIAKIIAHWNLCVEQSGFTGTFDFPATGYIRKSALADDFARCALQLDRIADDRYPLTGESIHAADPRCDDEGNDPREWCGNDIQAAHTVALQANDWIDSLTCSKAGADDAFFQMIEDDHAEALAENKAIDTAGKVIAAMRGSNILDIMPGICGGMYRDGMSNIMELSDTALRVERNRAHTDALDIDYCVEAVKEGGGYLGGYVVQNKDASFQVLGKRSTTGNPLHATYFSEDDYQQGRMKQFCFNGEIPVRLGEAVLAVAELAK